VLPRRVQAKAYQFFGWTSGGTWCWANGFCLWHVADASQAAPLGALDYAGVFIFAFGLGFELLADIQK
jgi:steroid 5-alpha reductase family enzyme